MKQEIKTQLTPEEELQSIIDKAKKTDDNLIELTCKLLEFDYSKYDDVSKQLRIVRQDAVKFVFEGDK